MERIIDYCLIIVWLVVTLLGLVYSDSPCLPVLCLCICLVCPFFIGSRFEKYTWFWVCVTVTLFAITISGGLVGVHVIKKQKLYAVTTSFYPIGRVLALGEQLDTLTCARCYQQTEENDTVVQEEEMYLLTGHKVSALCSRNAFILEGKELHFRLKDFGCGEIHVCSYIDIDGHRKVTDMYGDNINDTMYSPRVKSRINYTVCIPN